MKKGEFIDRLEQFLALVDKGELDHVGSCPGTEDFAFSEGLYNFNRIRSYGLPNAPNKNTACYWCIKLCGDPEREPATCPCQCAIHEGNSGAIDTARRVVEDYRRRYGPYQGHRSFTHWSIWMLISNDRMTYVRAKYAIAKFRNRDEGARWLCSWLPERTEHNKRVTLAGIKAALKIVEEEMG